MKLLAANLLPRNFLLAQAYLAEDDSRCLTLIDWQELALDWHWIDIRLVQDWNRIGMDWSLIDTGLVLDWHQIGTGSAPD